MCCVLTKTTGGSQPQLELKNVLNVSFFRHLKNSSIKISGLLHFLWVTDFKYDSEVVLRTCLQTFCHVLEVFSLG